MGREALGIAFLRVLVLCGWLTYAVFTEQFVAMVPVTVRADRMVPVTVRADRIGLQMSVGHVKVRGIHVCEARELAAGAVIAQEADRVPGVTTLLLGPITRDSRVGVR